MSVPATRPAAFDAAVIAYLPRLRKVSGILTSYADREDLVQSAIEAGLKYWRSYDPAKNLGTWLVYQMRHIAYEQRESKRPRGHADALEHIAVQPHQEDILMAGELLRSVEESPHAATMRLVAQGFTTEEIAERHGVSRQRVHQKITAFRRSAGRKKANA